MTALSKQELKSRLTELDTKIEIQISEFSGDLSQFHFFLKQSMTMQLHAFTSNEYPYIKPSLKEFEDIMFNIDTLNAVLDIVKEKQYLETELDK